MALGRTGPLSARLMAGAWLALACLVLLVPAAASADQGDYVGSFGPDGTAGTEFTSPSAFGLDQESGALYVGDDVAHVLYKFDASGTPLNWGGAAGYISGNKLTGVQFTGAGAIAQVAVDPETHVVYVTGPTSVRAFEADGEPHKFTAGPGAGTSELPTATKLKGVAVDGAGNIYASDLAAEKIRIYSRSGALVTEFSPSRGPLSPLGPGQLAVAPDGTLYATDVNHSSLAYAFEPSSFPVSSGTAYGLGQPLDDNPSFTLGLDPVTQYVYTSQLCPTEACEQRVAAYDELGGFVGAFGGEEPGELGRIMGVGVNGANGHAYALVTREGSAHPSQVSVFEAFHFFVGPPTVLAASVSNVTSSTALLRARINPNTLETTYWFEYGLADCATAPPGTCTKVPAAGAGASIGSGHNPVPVSAPLSSLIPGTKYFFRVVAENEEGPGAFSTRTFTTQVAQFGSGPSDGRVWELVTPAAKFGGVVTNGSLRQAEAGGNGIAFQTRGSLVENPEGNRALEASATLARRGGSSWSVSDLVPPHTEAGGLGFGPEFKLYSPDLGRALLEPRDDTPLSEEASERAPYLRTNTSPPSYRPLVTSKEGFANVESGIMFGGEANGARNPVSISGADDSLNHVVLSSEEPLVAGAENRSLYMWSDGALEPVSELPEGGDIVRAEVGSAAVSVRNAVSDDGSRVFWSPGSPGGLSRAWPALYVRDTVADETFRIDMAEAGATEEGEAHPVFMAASADGSVVFFTDSEQLTEDASPKGRDLYRCDVGDVGGGDLGCTDIEDLTAPLEGSGESGEAEDLALGMAEDGSALYFVAGAVLDTEPNGAGKEAAPGGPNLYLWREGQGVRFVASLSPEDRIDWGTLPTQPIGHEPRVAASSSPDGRYLTFMSERELTGIETDDPVSGEPVEQAFLYDAVGDSLRCVSCNLSGATDSGHQMVKDETEGGVIFPDPQGLWSGRRVGATLPEASEGEPTVGYALYRPRAVLDNGRAFFNSTSPLVSGDSNGTWDVYQYEPFGLGTCSPTAGSGTVAVGEDGCVSLVSSGTDEMPSVFMDSSASGDDVFFATFARLSALDTDGIVDVYDARVGGVEAVVQPPSPGCVGEACQPNGSPPRRSAPSSVTFNGPVNVEEKRHKHCHRGQRKVRRHGKVRCVKKHRKHRGSSRSKGRA